MQNTKQSQTSVSPTDTKDAPNATELALASIGKGTLSPRSTTSSRTNVLTAKASALLRATTGVQLSPREEQENEAILKSIYHARSRKPHTKFVVNMDADAVEMDADAEYPQGWLGVEIGYSPEERLIQLQFGRDFYSVGPRGKKAKKTDRNQSLWVPEWLLTEVRPPVGA